MEQAGSDQIADRSLDRVLALEPCLLAVEGQAELAESQKVGMFL
jgi:hypothetical protein